MNFASLPAQFVLTFLLELRQAGLLRLRVENHLVLELEKELLHVCSWAVLHVYCCSIVSSF